MAAARVVRWQGAKWAGTNGLAATHGTSLLDANYLVQVYRTKGEPLTTIQDLKTPAGKHEISLFAHVVNSLPETVGSVTTIGSWSNIFRDPEYNHSIDAVIKDLRALK